MFGDRREHGPQRTVSKIVVGSILGLAIIVTAFALLGLWWGLFACALACYEAWTLVNQYREDTISETIWEFAARPMIPLLFGIAVGWAAGSGYMGPPRVVGRAFAVGFLYGHFFFQAFRGRRTS
jgi:hypothetical protein